MRAQGAPREVWVCVLALALILTAPGLNSITFTQMIVTATLTGAVEIWKVKCLAWGRHVEVIKSMRCGTLTAEVSSPCGSSDGEEVPSPP